MKKTSQGYYEKKITMGRDENGRLVRKSVRAKTVRELEKKVFDLKQDLAVAEHRPDNDVTFGAYARHWIATKGGKAINTLKMYNLYLDKYILPEIGDMYFSEILMPDIQGIINRSFAHPNTCEKLRLTLKQIYELASDDGVPNSSINFKRIRMPDKKQKEDRRALYQDEKDAIFSAEMPDMERAFLYIIYYSGLRREEALALLPSDIDLEKKTVTVSRTVVFDKNEAVVREGEAKNAYSLRTVPLPSAAIPFLSEYLKGCEGYLFHQVRGSCGIMTKTSYNKFWNRIRDAMAKVAPTSSELTAHYFRHNYATMLYYSGVSIKMAAKLMGHKDTAMIMRIYAHLDEQKELAAVKLDKVFA